MAGKNWLTIAPEATFGTVPATGWTDIPVVDLGQASPIVTVQQADVMRRGQVAPTMDGQRVDTRGGTQTIKPYLATRGMLPLFAAAINEPTITPSGGMNIHRFDLDDESPEATLAVQIGREFADGTQDLDTFAGGRPSVLRLAQGQSATSSGVSADGIPTLEVDMNYRVFSPSTTERTSVAVDSVNYSGGDCTISIGPSLSSLSTECLNSFSLEMPTGFDFERRCISDAIDKPGRVGLIQPTVSLEWSYKDRTYYDAWINGTAMALRAEWALTVGGDAFSVRLDIPALMFTGDAPVESNESVTTQSLPGSVYGTYDNLGDPVPVLSLYVTTDEEYDLGS